MSMPVMMYDKAERLHPAAVEAMTLHNLLLARGQPEPLRSSPEAPRSPSEGLWPLKRHGGPFPPPGLPAHLMALRRASCSPC